MKLLVIDDNHDIRYTLQEIFETVGWQVRTAVDGVQGVELFQQERADVVIVDYHMPRMDGMATVKALRHLDNQVAIIVLTVDERQTVADKLLESGASDFALKPIKAPDLLSRVKVNLEICRLQQQHRATEREVLVHKGIGSGTLEIISSFLKEQMEPKTVEEISGQVGLAYQTVHRYLSYMTEQGFVKANNSYGKVGRPKNTYIWQYE